LGLASSRALPLLPLCSLLQHGALSLRYELLPHGLLLLVLLELLPW
tara:strand:+ start:418 stop:555 length:138 start_codon:yes stop_codon:yes gene_type:complete